MKLQNHKVIQTSSKTYFDRGNYIPVAVEITKFYMACISKYILYDHVQ